MRDLAVVLLLIGLIGITLHRAWYGVLALAVFSYLNPHAYAWGFAATLPAYQILFFVVCLSYFRASASEKQKLFFDWRVGTFFALWVFFGLTTLNAKVPDAAWTKLVEVSKIYLPFFFVLTLINTREKLYYLIATIAASIGIIAVKGGVFAIGSGFSHRIYGPPNTQFYENNAFAVATIMVLPLLILWRREVTNRWLRLGLAAALPLCVASSLSSWSRGGLLALGATGLVLLWHSRRKYLVIPLAAIGLIVVGSNLPEEWFGRMETLQTYEEDASAQQRLIAWRDGVSYALSHPLLGAGFEGWLYVTISDWHSSYVEILAEHGFIAFALWLSLLVGSVVSLSRLPRLARGVDEMKWVSNYAYMLRASLVAYAAGTLFLGLAYWDIFYHLVFISALVRKFALQELAERASPGVRTPVPPLFGRKALR